MSRHAYNACGNPAVLSLEVEEFSQAADGSATSDIRVTDIEINRGVKRWTVTECKP